MEIQLMTLNVAKSIFLFEILSIRNEMYRTALFGLSVIRAYSPAEERMLTLVSCDAFFSQFLVSQIKFLWGDIRNVWTKKD